MLPLSGQLLVNLIQFRTFFNHIYLLFYNDSDSHTFFFSLLITEHYKQKKPGSDEIEERNWRKKRIELKVAL